MKLAWELPSAGSRVETEITCLAWTGDAVHGQIAAGSESGVVGITLTDLVPPSPSDNSRYNFNLRGHHSAVASVTWNAAAGKLASSDQSGVIYVWSRNDERWSVELVNERGVKVRDVSWSPCGAAALICYEDNFVLIGSAGGQRIWSSNFPANQSIECGVWVAPRLLMLGLASGELQLISDDGAHLAERVLCQEHIKRLASPNSDSRIAALTQLGNVYIIREFHQVVPESFCGHGIVEVEWAPDGQLLAAASRDGNIYLLDEYARLIHRDRIPMDADNKVTAMTWAHVGRVLVVAAGGRVHVARVMHAVPSLYSLVAYQVWRLIGGDSSRTATLDLPSNEKEAISSFDHHVIRCRIPSTNELKSFASRIADSRCYCTIRPGSSRTKSFVLCVEHLGGLVPLLIGRQVSRLVPQFHISLHNGEESAPPGKSAQVEDAGRALSLATRTSTPQRMSLWRRSKRRIRSMVGRRVAAVSDTRMAQVSSNVCCTRFHVTAVGEGVPTFLAQVTYKTSVLHLQPRQMTVKLVDVEESETVAASEGGLSCAADELSMIEDVLGECSALRDAIAASTSNAFSTAPQPFTHEDDNRPLIDPDEPSTSSTWHEELDALDYIDDALGDSPCGDSSPLLAAPSSSDQPSHKPSAPQIKTNDDVRANLERIARVAAEIAHRRSGCPGAAKHSLGSIRNELLDLQRRVDDIERKAACEDVRRELRAVLRSLQKMNGAMSRKEEKCPGSSSAAPSSTSCAVASGLKTFTLHNKTPFWNEHNQVYQLDFGGRVTQESAKNFQIEVESRQALQFGRIEGGAYTLDFRRPFTAVQAFAIALASITQRLK